MVNILAVASGKGGVGKTIFSANLGLSIAKLGKTVILIDLDLGASNLHTCLGIKNTHKGIGNLINKQADSLDSLIIETKHDKLYFIPGDSLFTGTANLPYFSKNKIIKSIKELVADFIIIDLGAGSSYNTLDFFLAANSGFIMTTSETTSLLNAYSFLKSALHRYIFRSFPSKSREREVITDFLKDRIENADKSFKDLIMLLAEINIESGETVKNILESFYPKIVLSMIKSNKDIEIGSKLRRITYNNLKINMEYIGYLPVDKNVGNSILKREPVVNLYSDSSYSKSIYNIARKIVDSKWQKIPELFEDNEDLVELYNAYSQTT